MMYPYGEVEANIRKQTGRSAWSKGVESYALDLFDEVKEAVRYGYMKEADLNDWTKVKAQLLNGAEDWKQYSWGGSALIYDGQIAELLCNPTELKRTHGGMRRPNSREDWLDVQARALGQAAYRIRKAMNL